MSEPLSYQTYVSELNQSSSCKVIPEIHSRSNAYYYTDTLATDASASQSINLLGYTDSFIHRHLGPSPQNIQHMLDFLGMRTLEELIEKTVPPQIRMEKPLQLGESRSEFELLSKLKAIAILFVLVYR